MECTLAPVAREGGERVGLDALAARYVRGHLCRSWFHRWKIFPENPRP